MKTIARKTQKSAILLLELLIGMVMMAGALIILPIALFSADKSLWTNPFVWGVCLIGMLMFGSAGYFGFVRPFLLFRRLPDVQAETDGTYLYIHSKKQGKIPLSAISLEDVYVETPYIRSMEFLIHILSEEYGNVIIKVPGYGKYKLYYISRARRVPDAIAAITAGR